MGFGREHDVVIVGAGPVGLWLAGELSLAGVATLVVEREAVPSPHSKALGIHPRTIEVLAMRGLAKQFLASGFRVPLWHFGLLADKLDFRGLDTPFPFMLAIPQAHTEELLEQRARELGVDIVRGHAVAGLTQDEHAVTVDITGPDGPYRVTVPFVVGCDGAGSVVRKAAGIDFPGTPSRYFGYVGDVTLDSPPEQLGVTYHSADGALVVAPIPGGRFRVAGVDPAAQEPDRELTFEQLRASVTRVVGVDFGMRDPVWLSRFGSATRVASTYRRGRVLVAGDAAHMHFPTGGIGLNMGVQDAMNLGWKLAARVQGRATDELLDSYHAERHPIGVASSELTLAQTALIAASTPETMALRTVLSNAIATRPEFSRALANTVTALDTTYPSQDPAAHPLVGARVPDRDPSPHPELLGLLHDGHPVLLNLSGTTMDTADAVGIRTCASTLAADDEAWSTVGAALVRPDGHVWWAAPSGPGLDTAVRDAVAALHVRF